MTEKTTFEKMTGTSLDKFFGADIEKMIDELQDELKRRENIYYYLQVREVLLSMRFLTDNFADKFAIRVGDTLLSWGALTRRLTELHEKGVKEWTK